MDEEKSLVPQDEERAQLAVSSHIVGGLVPVDLGGLWRMSTWIARSGMAPKGLQTPEAIAVAIQMGMEVGLSPMQAVQNIAVINGRPSIWGDAALALVRGSGELVKFKEWMEGEPFEDSWTAICEVQRKGEDEPTVVKFSYADAKRAKLVPSDPKSPWATYPQRMLQMRARSWALRDKFTDILKGLQVREESSDVVVMTSSTDGTYEASPEKLPAKEALKQRLRQRVEKDHATEAQDAPESPLPAIEGSASAQEEKAPESAPEPSEEPQKEQEPEPEPPPEEKSAEEQAQEEQETEYNTYTLIKDMEAAAFTQWLQQNVDARGSWSKFITRVIDGKCKDLFKKQFVDLLPEILEGKAAAPKPPPKPQKEPKKVTVPEDLAEKTLEEKIAIAQDILNETYDEVAVETYVEWMQAQWECDLYDLKFKVTDRIIDDMIRDLQDPVRSTLTAFNK